MVRIRPPWRQTVRIWVDARVDFDSPGSRPVVVQQPGEETRFCRDVSIHGPSRLAFEAGGDSPHVVIETSAPLTLHGVGEETPK